MAVWKALLVAAVLLGGAHATPGGSFEPSMSVSEGTYHSPWFHVNAAPAVPRRARVLFVESDVPTETAKRFRVRRVFDPDIYYFDGIPTLVEPATLAWIVLGALFIAVAASIWPAHRASKLHPVQALRFE